MLPGSKRSLLLVAVVALVHATAFIVYQQPAWTTSWTDQVGYERLGHVLATTGEYTRYPGEQPFVPETIRTPGYPLFVAGVYRVFGESHMAVAIVQAVLFAALALVVFALTLRVATERVAIAAAALTAIFPPFPYYGALVLAELLCTVLVTLALWSAVAAVQRKRVVLFVASGALLGCATLVRPNVVLLPIAIAGLAGLTAAIRRDWPRVVPWVWALVAYGVVLAPWFAYNVKHLNRLTLTPAGGLGRATWEASWQGTWPGRVQSDLTRLAEANVDTPRPVLDENVDQFAAQHDMPAAPMLTYVHQWLDIRRIWDTPTDPRERTAQRIAADDEYWKTGIENIRRDRIGHVVRRTTVGAIVLWIGDIPIRFTDINETRPIVIRLMWLVQALLLLLAAIGLWMLLVRGLVVEAAIFAALFVYITAVHLPMLAEARYSLPAKPAMLALATIALAELAHRMLPQTGDYLPE